MKDTVHAPHYTVLEDQVLDDERLSIHAVMVYVALRRHVNADGTCWPGRERLAALARCSVRKVAEALHELEGYGYLERESGQAAGRSNTYHLGLPKHTVPTPKHTVPTLPGHTVPTEVSSETSNLKEEEETAVALRAPAHKIREACWREVGNILVGRGGPWAAGSKEALSLDRLFAWAKKREGVNWQRFVYAFLDGAWALKQGKVMGLTQKDVEFWKLQPYTPSRLLSNAAAICAVLESIAERNREPTQAELDRMLVGIK